MNVSKYQKNRQKQLKKSILKCIRNINIQRQHTEYPRIPGITLNILKFIKIYNFYKTINFRTNIKNQFKKNSNKTTGKTIEKSQNVSNILEVDGYKFILMDGKYYKITKKAYTPKEMQKWCNGRKEASKKMKIYHKNKRTENENLEKIKATKTSEIYDRELSKLPSDLQQLISSSSL
jgi:hypothetical protein